MMVLKGFAAKYFLQRTPSFFFRFWKSEAALSMLKKFISYYKPHWKLFAADMVCAVMIAAVDLLFPLVSLSLIHICSAEFCRIVDRRIEEEGSSVQDTTGEG